MALTPEQQQGIIKYAAGLFNASAGGYFTELATFVAAGNTPETMARALAGSTAFKNQGFAFSDGSTNDQFATAYLNQLLGNSVTANVMALAKTWFLNQINTVGRAQAVVNAINAIAATETTDPDLGNARKQLDNKIAVASYYTIDLSGTSTDLSVLQSTVTNVTSTTDVSTAAAMQAIIDRTPAATTGNTYNLTTPAENITGTAHNDTFNGSQTTLLLDVLNGAAGVDTLNYNDSTGVAGTNLNALGLSLTSIENVNVRSTGAAVATTTAFTGVTDLNIQQGTSTTATAGTGTNVSVSGVTGAIGINGGKNVTVTDATMNQNITIGATTVNAGSITVTDTRVGTGSIAIDGGTDVTVVASSIVNTTGSTIKVGDTTGKSVATDMPSGAVSVTASSVATNGDSDRILADITVVGGSSVEVTQSVTAGTDVATKSTTTTATTQGVVSVTGGSATTSVTVKQTAEAAGATAAKETAAVNQIDTITFAPVATSDKLKAGDSVTVGGLTFTAAKALTPAEVAAAFANLSKGALQGDAPAGNGIYTNTFGNYSTGAVTTTSTGYTINATASAAGPAIVIGASDTSATLTTSSAIKTGGVTNVPGTTGKLKIVSGTVTVADGSTGTDVLATVSLDGYGKGSTVKSDALTTLNLANSTYGAVVTNAAATTLALGLNNVTGAAALDLDGATIAQTYTTLNITTATKDSAVAITAAKVTTLAVDGTNAVDLTGSKLGAVKTVTVSGAAGVKGDASGATVTSVDASATSGNNTIKVDATIATYKGGTGVDTVTLSAINPTKAVSLGDGDDSLTLAAGTVKDPGALLSGGAGTDTLVMDAADAAAVSALTTFETKIDSFEKLSLGSSTVANVVNLANMDDISYVISANATAGNSLELTKMADSGTLELTTAGVGVKVTMADATGKSDSLNLVLTNKAATTVFGTVEAAGVESINISATKSGAAHTLTLKDAALKAVTISGDADLALNFDATNVAVATINGSAMTGVLTVQANGTVAATITGGSAADTLKASTAGATSTADVLIGGAGNDKLYINDKMSILTGGAGSDTFYINTASINVNSYATITDASLTP